MKKILFVVISIALFVSCKKDSDSNNSVNTQTGTFSYKVNGQQYDYSTTDETEHYVKMFKNVGTSPSLNFYGFNAINGPNNIFECQFKTDSLTTGPFIIDSTFMDANTIYGIIKHGILSGAAYYKTDSLIFNITSHNNGRVSGTFHGKMSPQPFDYNTRGTILITDGIINEVNVSY